MIICPACQAVNDDDDRFCGKCGTALTAAISPSADDAAGDWVALASDGKAPVAPVTPVAPPVQPAPAATPDLSARVMHTEPAPPAAAYAPPPPPPTAPVAPSFTAADDAAPPAAPGRKRSLWPLLVAGVALVAVGGAWLGKSLLGGGETAVVSTGDDRPASTAATTQAVDPNDTRTEWQRAYRDTVLSATPVQMVVGSQANVRNYPTTEETRASSTLAPGTTVSGRWVQGKDPTTRWLLLDSGGYVWEGNLGQPNGAGAPIAIAITNSDSSFGRDIDGYLRAIYQRGARITRDDGAAYGRVPNRRYRGVTVTGVAQYYEGSGIIFRESPAAVIAALRAGGLRIGNKGDIPMDIDAVDSCGVGPATDGARQYGATVLSCGH